MHDTVGGLLHAGAVGDDEYTGAVVGMSAHDPEHHLFRFEIELAGWFVGEEERRLVHEGHRESCPRIFTSRKLSGYCVSPV
ncbi:MAG: hypothetical protein ABIM89_18255, partial [Mycobacteriales bacterium]